MRRFENKVVVVTGGTSGIGLATARRFVKEGAQVVVFSRKDQLVEQACKELGCDGIACNVSNEKDRKTLINHIKTKYGKIDVLVLNAATSWTIRCHQDGSPWSYPTVSQRVRTLQTRSS
jgi:NAD(P)-dependent dehydrogenase (short-subunit alcohol dehydrogenase family)